MVGNQDITNLGIPSPDGIVNAPGTYSMAVLATAAQAGPAREFIDFIRSPEGQKAYTDGGFQGLTPEEMEGGKCYSLEPSTNPPTFVEWNRVGNSCK